MPGYTLVNLMAGTLQNTTTSPGKSLLRVVGAATPKRVRIEELEYSANGVPNATDCAIQVDFTYCSATGAGTATTTAVPQPLDAGTAIGTQLDTASSGTALNYTAEPTAFTAANTFYARGFNQRSGVLWQSQPGREIMQPATTNTGAVMRGQSTNYASTIIARLIFDEL